MGKVHYSAGIDYVTGALDTKHELIARLKHLHDANGVQTPPRGNELAHLQHFGEAAKRTTALIYAYKFPDSASDEQRALLDQYRLRFESQLKGAPDPQAPLDKSGKQKHYFRFDNFIRAMIYQELK